MTRPILAAAALLAAPALAQTAPPAAPPPAAAPAQGSPMSPPPEFMQAAQGFGQCIGRQSQAAGATVTPEAAAKAALAACATEKRTLDARFETWIASDGFPAAGRDMARQQYAAQMSGAEAQIAGRIRDARASGGTAPAATPTPAPPAAPRR